MRPPGLWVAMKNPSEGPPVSGHGLRKQTAVGVGARIRGRRLELDKSEQAFATLLGVTPETVAAWERGEGLDRAAVIRIADITMTSLEWLIAGLTPAEAEAVRAAASRDRASSGAARTASPRDNDRIDLLKIASHQHQEAKKSNPAASKIKKSKPAAPKLKS